MRAKSIHKTENWNNIATTIFFLLVLVYFAYHAISGERGFLALLQLSQKVDQMRMELDVVKAERIRLEHRVQRLHPDSLDLDLLEEQSRKILGYADPNERVYPAEDQ
jgi:cell division protein FtsB